jgi:hypothetical protein
MVSQWSRGYRFPVEIEAPEEAQDRILLDRVAPMRSEGPVSFLRANKPSWRLLVDTYTPPLDPATEDAVLDSDAAITVVGLDVEGKLGRSRREIVLASFAWAAADSAAHRAGYHWAVDNGRWDETAVAALAKRFEVQAESLAAFVAAARRGDDDPFGGAIARRAIVERWRGRATAVSLPEALDRHANRLGVFAEPAAILHYFLWRLTTS